MMGIGSNQSRRTPIPLCGGGHSEAFKLQCPECKPELLLERIADNGDLQTDMLRQMLDEGIKPKRTKWPSSSYTTPPKPQQQKETIVKGGMDVRARRPSTDA